MTDDRLPKGAPSPGGQGHRRLTIYQEAHALAVEVHRMSLTLPRFEMFEEGAQIRRSAKSVAAQIVEGYSLRRHKNEFLLYLQRAYASAVETTEHLELLRETGSLADEPRYAELSGRYYALAGLIYRFMEGVRTRHGNSAALRVSSTRALTCDGDL